MAKRIIAPPANGLHVYCDGAAIPNPGAGGWAFVIYRAGIEIEARQGGEPAATNNGMELTALLRAIEAVRHIPGPVTIWTDSVYCQKGATEWRHRWKALGWRRAGEAAQPHNQALANADLWQAIDMALTDSAADIAIQWIKGHAGHRGNERADHLAEIGRAAMAHQTANLRNDLDAEYRALMLEDVQ